MNPETTTATPRRRGRMWLIARWSLLALLSVFGYGAWKQSDFRAAISEAKALGWEWNYDDPIDAIQADWKAAFRAQTWFGGERRLAIPFSTPFEGHMGVIRRLAPKHLYVEDGSALKDLAIFGRIPGISRLEISNSWNLTSLNGAQQMRSLEDLWLGGEKLVDIGALRELPGLKTLVLADCDKLAAFEPIRGLHSLRELELRYCEKLETVDALAEMRLLESLNLDGCSGLKNLDGLKTLAALRKLNLDNCGALTNVDALKSLSALTELTLELAVAEQPGLSQQTVDGVRAALPKTNVVADRLPPPR